MEFNHNSITPTNDSDRRKAELFIKCLQIGNRELILQYVDKMYLKKCGLAMGITDSPDLANLFANSEEEALAHIQNVEFDDCRIEWNVSDRFQVFLDMTLYIDEYNTLQHMPYRKTQSHQERIPWISHHPLDVKRGTFIGEMHGSASPRG